MLTKEILYRVLITLGLIFIGSKILSTVFLGIWENIFKKQSGNHKDHDIDRLIENKKEMLRHTHGLGKVETTQTSAAPNKNSTIRAYQEILLKGGNTSDAKNMLEFFDHLQWGDGKYYQEIQQLLVTKYAIRKETKDVATAWKYIVDQNLLLDFNGKNPATLSEAKELLLFQLFLSECAHNVDHGPSPLCIKISRSSMVHENSVLKAMDLLWATIQGKKEKESLDHILLKGSLNKGSAGSKTEMIVAGLFLNGKKQEYLSTEKIIYKISESAKTFDSLMAIPPLNGKNDVEGALRTFGFKKMPTSEELKKTYKELVNKRHPDKLLSKGLGENWIQIATKNFTHIQTAYDILKADLEK